MSKPGTVVRIAGKNKETVDVQYDDKIVTVKNLLKNINLGDQVMVNDELIIEILHH